MNLARNVLSLIFPTYSTITGAVDGLTDDDGAEDITEEVSDSALDSLLW